MLYFKDAQSIILENATSFGTETITLDDAYGRIVAEDIFADRDYPPFNRSAMDGYAFMFSDFESGIRIYELVEVIFAGMEHKAVLQKGQCYKIMTGAAVPDAANVVVRREDCEENGNEVTIKVSDVIPFQNIAKKGEDLQKGKLALQAPLICKPAVMGVLASLGAFQIEVKKRPQVALFTTGNEVVHAKDPVSKVQIRNSNQWVLQSLLKKNGITPSIYEHILDDENSLQVAIKKGLEQDIIILSGGVSAGDADYVPKVLQHLGVNMLFHKVAIKPGKPIWCGKLPAGGMVFALPGNPFSCLVTFTLFVQPYLNACFGVEPETIVQLPLQFNRKKKSSLDEFFPVIIKGHPTGLHPLQINGSGDIRLAFEANALAHHPSDKEELYEGTYTEAYLFNMM